MRVMLLLRGIAAVVLFLWPSAIGDFGLWAQVPGKPGDVGIYLYPAGDSIPSSLVTRLELRWGPKHSDAQWSRLDAYKADGRRFRVWLLTRRSPARTAGQGESPIQRYLLQEGNEKAVEYQNQFTGNAVLPSHGFWPHQRPKAPNTAQSSFVFPPKVSFLGHGFDLESIGVEEPFQIPTAKILRLPCDLEIGAKRDRRDRREARRFDGDPVELFRYEPADYPERIGHGQTTFNTPADQVDFVRRESVFYCGDDPLSMRYPECLFRSNYLGPNPDFLDEPAVRTSFALQAALKEGRLPASELTISRVLERFQAEFERANGAAGPLQLQKALEARRDVSLGQMQGASWNVWSWETLISSGAYQLCAAGKGGPGAIVYEGRGAVNRDLPLFNSSTGAQFSTVDAQAWLDIVYGMLRGAARLSGKRWGISIYGQFERAEVYRALSYGYECGASFFLFWMGSGEHHVPYEEQLALSRFIGEYARQRPDRNVDRLRKMAEVLILFPAGYTLLSKEPMWWLPPLHYEKKNKHGLKYREVLARVAAEMERCYREGVCYDLAWDLEGFLGSASNDLNTSELKGYREVIRVCEDGRVIVQNDSREEVFYKPRWPSRPKGKAPGLKISLSREEGKAPMTLVAHAEVTEHQSPVHFTPAHDEKGVWRNTKVIWQLYGPGPDDFAQLSDQYDVRTGLLPLELNKAGVYRLRASVVDRAGRSTVQWKRIIVKPKKNIAAKSNPASSPSPQPHLPDSPDELTKATNETLLDNLSNTKLTVIGF